MGKLILLAALGLTSALIVNCSSTSRKPSTDFSETALIRSDYTPQELTQLCDAEIKKITERVDQLSKRQSRPLSFADSFGELEDASADFQDGLSPLNFMYSVSTNADLRAASQECDSKSSQISIEIFSRRDLYKVMKNAETDLKSAQLDAADRRLISETMKGFKLSGLELSDAKLEQFKKLKKEMADISIQFSGNLNNNTDSAEMTPNEMDGIPENVKSRFTLLPNGNYQIPAKATFYSSFIENASNSAARKKMMLVYENREAKKNTELMQKMMRLRKQAAKVIGFKDWADYRTYDKMSKNGKTAWDFLQGLKGKLRKSYQKDYDLLLAEKKLADPKATRLEPWDGAYFSNQLRKRKYSIDEEVLREYFPADLVVPKMFEIYSRLLKVKFIPVEKAIVWHPSVGLYEVRDEQSGKLIAYFFTDLYPREGKYGHAAAFPLRSGREIEGAYTPPVASIVANLTPPSGDRPSLLSHDEVETLFHEFGHIMHMTLTKVKYASLSGASVAWDFVEAPSQMLENWAWQPSILKMFSGHYKDRSQKLPDDLIQKLIASRKFNQAWGNTRQLLFGIFDMTLHRSSQDLDVTKSFQKLYKELTGMTPLADAHFPATFGHIMGGYDAGYYGYLWSNVFAFDMFTLFENQNLLSPEVGYKYRQTILEQGNLRDANVTLEAFLGRKSSTKAFFDFLGIK
ncbi:MAG: M3 family metallopeptidase [Pseudobdellovibrionaceae bacterium]